MTLKVGIVGASGIGQFHALWYTRLGCSVESFVGSSAETTLKTKYQLQNLFGFKGHGYSHLEDMLAENSLDMISICSPRSLHYEHVLSTLNAGVNVLCEKPLLWCKNSPPSSILDKAVHLVTLAKSTNRLLALSAQYAALWDPYAQLYSEIRGAIDSIDEFYFYMESSRHERAPIEYGDIWAELGPHALALLQKCFPNRTVDLETVDVKIGADEFNTCFDYVGLDKRRCKVRIGLRTIKTLNPIRRFGINGMIVDFAFSPLAGIYKTCLSIKDKQIVCEDLLCSSIRNFIQKIEGQGELLVDSTSALSNLQLQLQILQRCEEISGLQERK